MKISPYGYRVNVSVNLTDLAGRMLAVYPPELGLRQIVEFGSVQTDRGPVRLPENFFDIDQVAKAIRRDTGFLVEWQSKCEWLELLKFLEANK